MDEKTFLQRLDSIQDIPTLPVVAVKVNNMLRDYDTTINKLCETIEKDQAIVSRILRLVNSAFYGFQSKIDNIHHAVIMLGFNTVRNAVLSVSVIETFSVKDPVEGFDIADFWRHSVAVAVTSGHLAKETRLVAMEEAFIAGLLHDIGKVILTQYFSELFSQVWASVNKDDISFYEAEKRLLPVDHTQIGEHLARKWQLPANLVDAIRYHHAIRKVSSNPGLLMVVHVADAIVNNYKTDLESVPDFPLVDPEAAKIMAPQLETVSDWFPDVSFEIESACEFFTEEV